MALAYNHYEYYTNMRNIVKRNIQPDLKAIGRRIRQIRGFDLTQEEFSQVLGVGQAQLSKYEKGQSEPTLEILLRLKAHCGKSLDWIVSGEENT